MKGSTPIAVPPGTRALRIVRTDDSWVLWIHTSDFIHGTYLRMYDTGKMERVTVYKEGYEDIWELKPPTEY